jgi:gluconolactonase
LTTADDYPHDPNSERHPDVPKGTVTKSSWTSKIFPARFATTGSMCPTQYRPDKPACVMIFQDGGGYVAEDGSWRVPIVFDNLINKHEMPISVGIFINPGVLPALSGDQQNRYNRCFEYDALGERYARFPLEEILPEVRKS